MHLLKTAATLTVGALLGACTGEPRRAADDRPAGAVGTALNGAGTDEALAARRRAMVVEQMQARDIRDRRVLDVLARVPRHEFVPRDVRRLAYEDRPLPIGHDQTISQPYIVAYMTEVLDVSPEHRVLEIGTGSGYQAAVLAELAREVFTIEIVPELAERAEATLERLRYRNVRVLAGNGYLGWPEHAPYDRIMVTAAPEQVPPALVEQLAVGGTMVIPVGGWLQEIRIVTKTAEGIAEQRTIPVRFVPMVDRPS